MSNETNEQEPLFNFEQAVKQMKARGSRMTDILQLTGGMNGEPIFGINGLRDAKHPLARLLRIFLIEEKISLGELAERHNAELEKLGVNPSRVSSSLSNLKKSVMNPAPTFNNLRNTLFFCGYDLTNISLEITERQTGKVKVLSTKDIKQLIDSSDE
jgi:hypothetical protein